MSRVVEITDIEELEKITKKYPSNLIIIDFSASWCMPCQTIKPVFAELSKKYENCIFLKVDVDEADELMDFFGPRSLPTFILMKNGKAFHKWSGADQDTLKRTIEKYMNFDISDLEEDKDEDEDKSTVNV